MLGCFCQPARPASRTWNAPHPSTGTNRLRRSQLPHFSNNKRARVERPAGARQQQHTGGLIIRAPRAANAGQRHKCGQERVAGREHTGPDAFHRTSGERLRHAGIPRPPVSDVQERTGSIAAMVIGGPPRSRARRCSSTRTGRVLGASVRERMRMGTEGNRHLGAVWRDREHRDRRGHVVTTNHAGHGVSCRRASPRRDR